MWEAGGTKVPDYRSITTGTVVQTKADATYKVHTHADTSLLVPPVLWELTYLDRAPHPIIFAFELIPPPYLAKVKIQSNQGKTRNTWRASPNYAGLT